MAGLSVDTVDISGGGMERKRGGQETLEAASVATSDVDRFQKASSHGFLRNKGGILCRKASFFRLGWMSGY
jgi:hypothetical protein